ncbi:hypothetical protein DFJ74DRAFT_654135 [Hyaloraphidium curvatum]|nr:hypothetical protein DFJ74DRAFT_654135 [Hyaloraphidium curvatum]
MTATMPPSNPASNNWYFQLGSYFVVPNRAQVPVYPWIPDGHLPVLPDGKGNWMLYWSMYTNFRTLGSSPYPEDHVVKEPATSVFGGRFSLGLYYSGGMWLMSVYRMTGNNLIGFYHAEDRWSMDSDVVWKSIGVAYSADNGLSWRNGGLILRHPQNKPASPQWGGVGDMDVLWDPSRRRWICYFSDGRMSMAISTDVNAAPGTWRKWYQGGFNAEGLGGQHDYIEPLVGAAGANPSVHWNTYLGRWVMVYGSWSGAVFISSSRDGTTWDVPRQVVTSQRGDRAWYPTIIGDQGDRVIGQDARLYYADFGGGGRDFARRLIRFVRND